jgi:hypothetical protein
MALRFLFVVFVYLVVRRAAFPCSACVPPDGRQQSCIVEIIIFLTSITPGNYLQLEPLVSGLRNKVPGQRRRRRPRGERGRSADCGGR